MTLQREVGLKIPKLWFSCDDATKWISAHISTDARKKRCFLYQQTGKEVQWKFNNQTKMKVIIFSALKFFFPVRRKKKFNEFSSKRLTSNFESYSGGIYTLLMPRNPFWDSVGLPQSNTAESRPKKCDFAEISAPQNRPFCGGVVEIFPARTKGVLKASEKFFGDP